MSTSLGSLSRRSFLGPFFAAVALNLDRPRVYDLSPAIPKISEEPLRAAELDASYIIRSVTFTEEVRVIEDVELTSVSPLMNLTEDDVEVVERLRRRLRSVG